MAITFSNLLFNTCGLTVLFVVTLVNFGRRRSQAHLLELIGGSAMFGSALVRFFMFTHITSAIMPALLWTIYAMTVAGQCILAWGLLSAASGMKPPSGFDVLRAESIDADVNRP